MEFTEFGGSPPTVCVRARASMCTRVQEGISGALLLNSALSLWASLSLTRSIPFFSARLAGPRAQVILQSPHPITGLAGVQVDSSRYKDVEDLNPGHHACTANALTRKSFPSHICVNYHTVTFSKICCLPPSTK